VPRAAPPGARRPAARPRPAASSGRASASSWRRCGPARRTCSPASATCWPPTPRPSPLFAGLTDWPIGHRNTIRYTFFHPAARDLFADWDHSAETTAAHLRSLAADTPDDPAVSALIAELLDGSPEFARLWQRHDVRQRRGEAKPFRHPRVGEFTLTYEVLYLADGQRMTVSATPQCYPWSAAVAENARW
jgi:hypothetical protein